MSGVISWFNKTKVHGYVELPSKTTSPSRGDERADREYPESIDSYTSEPKFVFAEQLTTDLKLVPKEDAKATSSKFGEKLLKAYGESLQAVEKAQLELNTSIIKKKYDAQKKLEIRQKHLKEQQGKLSRALTIRKEFIQDKKGNTALTLAIAHNHVDFINHGKVIVDTYQEVLVKLFQLNPGETIKCLQTAADKYNVNEHPQDTINIQYGVISAVCKKGTAEDKLAILRYLERSQLLFLSQFETVYQSLSSKAKSQVIPKTKD